MLTTFMNRRRALATFLGGFLASASAQEAKRKLVFQVVADGFNAPVANIEAVVGSAALVIWEHCASTTFEFGFRIYRNEKHPITHYVPEDGRIIIGLNTESTRWAQYTYQFAHEFGHALMDHSNDWRKLWRDGNHANQWLEESLCEVASLFALRAMGRVWETDPPYENWRKYAVKLTEYARERLEIPAHQLPPGQAFPAWLKSVEAVQRGKWTRENNTIVAAQLLPLFERDPAGWDALPALNLCTRERDKSLRKFLEEWLANADPKHRAFITKVTETLLPPA